MTSSINTLTADQLQVLSVMKADQDFFCAKYGDKYRDSDEQLAGRILFVGYTCVESMVRSDLIGVISDTSKDVQGCRLRLDFGKMSTLELNDEADYWVAAARREFEAHEAAEFKAQLLRDAEVVVLPATEAEMIQDRLEGVK